MFALAVSNANTEMLNGLTAAVILVGITVPIAYKIARTDRDPTLVGIVMAAVIAKMLGSLLRYYMAFEFYGNSDALQYHRAAELLAPRFRSGFFDPEIGHLRHECDQGVERVRVRGLRHLAGHRASSCSPGSGSSA